MQSSPRISFKMIKRDYYLLLTEMMKFNKPELADFQSFARSFFSEGKNLQILSLFKSYTDAKQQYKNICSTKINDGFISIDKELLNSFNDLVAKLNALFEKSYEINEFQIRVDELVNLLNVMKK